MSPTVPPNRHTVFVYGTLKKGQPNYSVLADTKGEYTFMGKGRTVDAFPLVVGTVYNIPFVLHDRGKGQSITGEVYHVDDEKLEVLDELEAHPLLYTRRQEKVTMENGDILDAWIYIIHKWKPDFLSQCSLMMDNYDTQGSHGRAYVDKYLRAALMKEDGTNLFIEIMGTDPRDEACLVGFGKIPTVAPHK